MPAAITCIRHQTTDSPQLYLFIHNRLVGQALCYVSVGGLHALVQANEEHVVEHGSEVGYGSPILGSILASCC